MPRGTHRLMLGGLLLGAATLIAAACGGGGDEPAAAGEPAAAVEDDAAQDQAEPTSDADDEETADAAVGAGPFTVTRVDRGTKPDIAIDAAGDLWIAYMLERLGDEGWVKVARPDGSDVTQLHTGYVYGPLDLETSADGRVAVGFHDHDSQDGSIALRRDGVWSSRGIPHGGHDGWDSAIAFGDGETVYYLGVDPVQFESPDGVELAVLEGDTTTVRRLGSGPQPYEWGVDVEVDPAGAVRAVFFDAGSQDLVYAVESGEGFSLTPIFSEGDAGRFAVLEIDSAGRSHVAFFRAPGRVNDIGRAAGDVVYGVQNDDGSWSFEAVGQVPDQVLGFEAARRTVALALDADDQPLVAFIDTRRLSLARRSSDGAWSTQIVAEADDAPFQVVGLALDGEGQPHLTFATVTANGPLDGEIWYARPS